MLKGKENLLNRLLKIVKDPVVNKRVLNDRTLSQ